MLSMNTGDKIKWNGSGRRKHATDSEACTDGKRAANGKLLRSLGKSRRASSMMLPLSRTRNVYRQTAKLLKQSSWSSDRDNSDRPISGMPRCPKLKGAKRQSERSSGNKW